MILKIFLYLCLSHGLMAVYGKTKCTLYSNGVCEFQNVHTTEIDQYFEPTADNLEKVTAVKFEDSRLEIFTNESCGAFPNLEIIYANYLGIINITKNALENCKNLNTVWFQNNKIKKLSNELFKNTLELKEIHLDNNLLEEFDPKVFWNNKKLTMIWIGKNYIHDFLFNEFPQLNNLERLGVESNELDDIDEKEILKKFPNLQIIFFNDNPFSCDRVKVMIDEFTKRNVTIVYSDSRKNGDRGYELSKIGNANCLSALRVLESLQHSLKNIKKHLKYQNRMIVMTMLLFGITLFAYGLKKLKNQS